MASEVEETLKRLVAHKGEIGEMKGRSPLGVICKEVALVVLQCVDQ